MRLRLNLTLLMAILLLAASHTFAQDKRGPATAQEKDTAVKAARLLESDPFNKDAKKIRQWFTEWIIEVPDIHIELCGGYLGPVFGTKKNYEAELFGQTMFSSAAFIIEHPDQATDRLAVNLAGLEGALKTYEAILQTKPNARWTFLDELIVKRDKGELKAYVQEVMDTKCKPRQ